MVGDPLRLTLYPHIEEPPQHHGISHEADNILQDQLRAQSPPKEPEIARMAKHAVYSAGDQRMTLFVLDLHRVVEITSRLRHGQRPHRLPDQHEHHSNPGDYRTGWDRPVVGQVAIGCQPVRKQTLRHRRSMRNVIRDPIRAEQKGRHIRVSRIVCGGGVVFQKVEEAQRREEEGSPPEWDGLQGAENRDDDGYAEDDAEEECADGDLG